MSIAEKNCRCRSFQIYVQVRGFVNGEKTEGGGMNAESAPDFARLSAGSFGQHQAFSFAASRPAMRPFTRQSTTAQEPNRTAPCTPLVASPAA